ncbi:phosphoglycerate dehydrogenase [Salipaludibacillus neizhouensis]|uniref:phosphoglycerate dehydrogenase n=1 Tax=Salipaludibacillus neizhouensis TaxID=885475 RepID=UPI0015FFBD68|nr:phosphoglycerate dehydrogenase [Salipaludibacillus neizhouensis]
MKILVTSASFAKFNKNIIDELEKKGCKIEFSIPFDVKDITNAEGLIVGLEKIDATVIDEAKKLKIISKHGVGVDNIDLEYARSKGIIVSNTPETNNDAVADLAFGLMISAARSIPQANNDIKRNTWPRYDGRSVWKKTLGVIGLGSIGKGVAKRGKGFSMNVLGYDITEKTSEERDIGIDRVSLEELITSSDYISLHVPLNKYTEHMISTREFDLMRENAVLINSARGGLINEKALYEALYNKKILACALDVFEVEPPENNKLLTLDNLIVTPHMGAYTVESGELMSQKAAQNISSYLLHDKILNQVN